MKRKNPAAKALREPIYKQRVIKNAKRYTRKKKHGESISKAAEPPC